VTFPFLVRYPRPSRCSRNFARLLSAGILLMLFANSVGAQPQQVAVTPTASSQPLQSLTLAQAEALAVKKNPQITVARLQALVSYQFVREQRSALLPTAYLSVTGVLSLIHI